MRDIFYIFFHSIFNSKSVVRDYGQQQTLKEYTVEEIKEPSKKDV